MLLFYVLILLYCYFWINTALGFSLQLISSGSLEFIESFTVLVRTYDLHNVGKTWPTQVSGNPWTS